MWWMNGSHHVHGDGSQDHWRNRHGLLHSEQRLLQKRACVLGETDGVWQKASGFCMSVGTIALLIVIVIIVIAVVVLILVRKGKKSKAVGGVKGKKTVKGVPKTEKKSKNVKV